MPSFEEDFTSLSSSPSPSLPGASLLATTTHKDIVYEKSFGASSLESNKARPLTKDTIFWIASCTKLLTSIAVLQLVESGKANLDDDVSVTVPELSSGPTSQILVDFEEDSGKPILKKRVKPITFRTLLSHTSGLAYEFLSPEIGKWFKHEGISQEEVAGDILRGYSSPCLFEPGEKWMYSPGLDWAGIAIARIAGVEDLQAYMRKNIWEPLGIDPKDMAFRVNDLKLSESETAERLVHLTLRKQGDQSIVSIPPMRDPNPKDAIGGGGIFASPNAYLKVLRSLLRNDGKLLKAETRNKYMLEPQLVEGKIGKVAHESFVDLLDNMIGAKMLTGGLPLPKEEGAHEYQHGLLGLLDREKGSEEEWTLSWGGLPNLFWHVDVAKGVAGIYASQIIPPGDPLSMEVALRWRKEIGRRFGRGPEEKSNL